MLISQVVMDIAQVIGAGSHDLYSDEKGLWITFRDDKKSIQLFVAHDELIAMTVKEFVDELAAQINEKLSDE